MCKKKCFFFIRTPYNIYKYCAYVPIVEKTRKENDKTKTRKRFGPMPAVGGSKSGKNTVKRGLRERASVGHTPQLTGSILISGPRGRDLEGLSRPFAAPSPAAAPPFPCPLLTSSLGLGSGPLSTSAADALVINGVQSPFLRYFFIIIVLFFHHFSFF